MGNSKYMNFSKVLPSITINNNTFYEYLNYNNEQNANEISMILGLLASDLSLKGLRGVVEYDGVKLILLTDSDFLREAQKSDCFFDRDLRYILKTYSKMLLPYNKNYNEEEDI